MTVSDSCDVLVLGAGVIGATLACRLRREGHAVLLVERDQVAAGASAGNAGILAFPEITPEPAPGIMRKAPRWLLDPLGPLAIRPAYALAIAPWLWRFWRASAPAAYARGADALCRLNLLARAEMQPLAALPELAPHFRQTGTLDLYDSAASLAAAQPVWAARARAGFEFERVGRADIDRLQPGLDARFTQAIWSPGGMQVDEPRDYTRALAQLALARGARFRQGEAVALAPEPAQVQVRFADGTSVAASHVVLACGAWSRPLAACLGDRIPLDTERGYNTTLPPQAFELRRQLYFNDHGFVVTPLASGIRVGGAVELAGFKLAPQWRRAQALLERAREFLPRLAIEGGRRWMGFRPSLPDGLPVLGFSAASRRVVYAFGHGHLGLTQSAATARLVAELIGGRAPAIDLRAFDPRRFSRN